MAAGVPVIASNCGSLPEIVGDAGRIVDPENIEETVHVVHEILTTPALRDSYARKGRERASAFSWQHTAARTLNLYRQVYAR